MKQSHFGKMKLTSWTLLQHVCPHFWAWLLNTIAITTKSEDKYVAKVFNWPEFHFSEVTSYKIHTLMCIPTPNRINLKPGKKIMLFYGSKNTWIINIIPYQTFCIYHPKRFVVLGLLGIPNAKQLVDLLFCDLDSEKV